MNQPKPDILKRFDWFASKITGCYYVGMGEDLANIRNFIENAIKLQEEIDRHMWHCNPKTCLYDDYTPVVSVRVKR